MNLPFKLFVIIQSKKIKRNLQLHLKIEQYEKDSIPYNDGRSVNR